ncbi:MAG TPA: RDD family protein [Virgibacillus sp.]|nr:RDD family protein [Virgibacillus sp.]
MTYKEENTDELTDESLEYTDPVPLQYKRRYAGFWMRGWAFIVDLLIVFSINGIILSPLKLLNDGLPIQLSLWTINGIMAAIIFYLYFLFMTKKLGQTAGKMIFGLEVIRADEQPLQWSDLLFREVIGRFIYNTFFFLHFLYLMIVFSNEKQGLHDVFGNTRVIHIED